MEMEKLWRDADRLIANEMVAYVYDGLIAGNLSPVRLDGSTLTLCIGIPQLKAAVIQQTALMEKCVSMAAGQPMKVILATRAELESDPAPAERPPVSGTVQLNPNYTFEKFIVGSSNRFAQAAAVAVAEMPAKVYNPLFLYGGVGLGKTHLMHAIGHRVHEKHPEMTMLYITSETFTNELISAIQQGRNVEFRNRFRNVDILMVDDIQFIAGHTSTQEEFFHTFNTLHSDNKQIILTSDRPPQEIARLEERLRSRFAWGLMADLQRPDLETRIAILRAKAQQVGYPVPAGVLEMIAQHVQSNIRELEGSYNRLIAYARLVQAPEITEGLCQEALRDIFDNRSRRVIDVNLVKRTVCEYYMVDMQELTGPSRRREIALPRQVAMYLTRELTGLSLPQIGLAFGNRDHTTVMHAISQIDTGVKTNSGLQSQVNDIRHLIREG